jgi:hypothetical protein
MSQTHNVLTANHWEGAGLSGILSAELEPYAALRAVWRAIDCTVARVFFTRWFSSWISRSWRAWRNAGPPTRARTC